MRARWVVTVGGEPMAILVPPPHGVTGSPSSAATASRAAISSLLPGRTTASGVRPSST